MSIHTTSRAGLVCAAMVLALVAALPARAQVQGQEPAPPQTYGQPNYQQAPNYQTQQTAPQQGYQQPQQPYAQQGAPPQAPQTQAGAPPPPPNVQQRRARRQGARSARYQGGQGSSWRSGRNGYGFAGTYGGCSYRGIAGRGGYRLAKAC